MGHDMYLQATKEFGGYPDHRDPDSEDEYLNLLHAGGLTIGDVASITPAPVVTMEVNVAYWRKVTAIHFWFVRNVQDGDDDFRRRPVSREQLTELRDTAQRVVGAWDAGDKVPAHTELPPQPGFEDGGREGKYYIEFIQSTVEDLDRILSSPRLEDADFYYQSSWRTGVLFP